MIPRPVHIPLGPIDHLAPPFYPTISLYLPIKNGVSTAKVFQVLQEGLHRTFVQLPWLGGQVQLSSSDTPGWRPGQLEIVHDPVDINGLKPYQLKFNELPVESYESYDELKESGFPIEAFAYESLIWAPFIADVRKGADVMVAQANFIPGGCILTVAVNHSASDATGLSHVLNFWAENCSDVQLLTSDEPKVLPPEISDRSILERIWAEEGKHISFQDTRSEIWKILQVDPRLILSSEPSNSTVPSSDSKDIEIQKAPELSSAPRRIGKSAVFYIAPANIAKLREECDPVPGTTSVSVNDAICSLIWRSLMKARAAKLNKVVTLEEARLGMAVNGRYHFSPSLPPDYLANLAFGYMSSLPLVDLISPETTISSVASLIRDSARDINTKGALMETYALARQIPDFGVFLSQGPAKSGYTMWITSLLAAPFSSICFGDVVFSNGGKPEAFRPVVGVKLAHDLGLDVVIIMPRKSHGGVEFVTFQSEEEMALLLKDLEFDRHAMLVS